MDHHHQRLDLALIARKLNPSTGTNAAPLTALNGLVNTMFLFGGPLFPSQDAQSGSRHYIFIGDGARLVKRRTRKFPSTMQIGPFACFCKDIRMWRARSIFALSMKFRKVYRRRKMEMRPPWILRLRREFNIWRGRISIRTCENLAPTPTSCGAGGCA